MKINLLLISWKKPKFLIHFFQCSLINSGSTLPTHKEYLASNCLYSITFSQDDISKIIQNLVSGKAHGHDNISIRVLKICGSAIFLNNVLIQVFSHLIGKRAILFLFIKKVTKQTLKNYCPVSLLPICGKILERLMFNEMFKFY